MYLYKKQRLQLCHYVTLCPSSKVLFLDSLEKSSASLDGSIASFLPWNAGLLCCPYSTMYAAIDRLNLTVKFLSNFRGCLVRCHRCRVQWTIQCTIERISFLRKSGEVVLMATMRTSTRGENKQVRLEGFMVTNFGFILMAGIAS